MSRAGSTHVRHDGPYSSSSSASLSLSSGAGAAPPQQHNPATNLNAGLLAHDSAAQQALQAAFDQFAAGRLPLAGLRELFVREGVRETLEATRLLLQADKGGSVTFRQLHRALVAGTVAAPESADAAFGASSGALQSRAAQSSTSALSNVHSPAPSQTARADRAMMEQRTDAAGVAASPISPFSLKARQFDPRERESGAGALIQAQGLVQARSLGLDQGYGGGGNAAAPSIARDALLVQSPCDLTRPERPAATFRASADDATFSRSSSGNSYFSTHIPPDQRVHAATLQVLAPHAPLYRHDPGIESPPGADLGLGTGGLALSPRHFRILAESPVVARSELLSREQRRIMSTLRIDGAETQHRELHAALSPGRVPLHASRMARSAAPFATD